MASKELMEMINRAISMELQVSIQYMWHHVLASGVRGELAKDMFKKVAIEEMKHAEEMAEQLDRLGGIPTHRPAEIKIGNNAMEFLKINAQAERDTVKFYKQIIEKAAAEKEYSTEDLFIEILADEEEHLQDFESYMED